MADIRLRATIRAKLCCLCAFLVATATGSVASVSVESRLVFLFAFRCSWRSFKYAWWTGNVSSDTVFRNSTSSVSQVSRCFYFCIEGQISHIAGESSPTRNCLSLNRLASSYRHSMNIQTLERTRQNLSRFLLSE